MTKNIASLIRRIVGRIKKMANWLIAFGSMIIPLAIVMRIEIGKSSLDYVLIALGFAMMVYGLITVQIEERNNKIAERIKRVNESEDNRVSYNRFLADKTVLENILAELKRINTQNNEGEKQDAEHKERDTKQ